MRDIVELWFLANSILTGVKTTRYTRSGTSNNVKFDSHENWALSFRKYASEFEHKALTATIRGYRVVGIEQAIKSFRRRLPGDILETGLYLLDAH